MCAAWHGAGEANPLHAVSYSCRIGRERLAIFSLLIVVVWTAQHFYCFRRRACGNGWWSSQHLRVPSEQLYPYRTSLRSTRVWTMEAGDAVWYLVCACMCVHVQSGGGGWRCSAWRKKIVGSIGGEVVGICMGCHLVGSGAHRTSGSSRGKGVCGLWAVSV